MIIVFDLNIGFDISENECAVWKEKLLGVFFTTFLVKLNEQSNDSAVESRLKNYFESRFCYNDSGVPRVWTVFNDMESIYKTAISETMVKLDCFSKLQFTDLKLQLYPRSKVSQEKSFEVILIPDLRLIKIRKSVEEKCQRIYLDAKRSTVALAHRIPPWFYALLLVLGWNELTAILSSPFLLMTSLLFGLLTFILYSMNLLPVVVSTFFYFANQVQQTVWASLTPLLHQRGEQAVEDS
jgi:protein SEY1